MCCVLGKVRDQHWLNYGKRPVNPTKHCRKSGSPAPSRRSPLRSPSAPRRRRRLRLRRSPLRGCGGSAAGRRQRVSVDMRDAAIEFRSERYLRVDGKYPADDPDRLSGLYRCGDGRWVRLHTSLPHHYRGMLALLALRRRSARRYSARSTTGKARRSKLRPPTPGSSLPRAAPSPSGIGIRRAARSPRFRC